MEQAKFVINTIMSREDYRKFLYIATFRRNKGMVPLLGLISLLGSLIISMESDSLNLTKFLISWIGLFALAIAVAVLRVEMRTAQRLKTDKTGAFDSVNTLKFYEDRIVMENKALKSTAS